MNVNEHKASGQPGSDEECFLEKIRNLKNWSPATTSLENKEEGKIVFTYR